MRRRRGFAAGDKEPADECVAKAKPDGAVLKAIALINIDSIKL
jgi:hypothetical protein